MATQINSHLSLYITWDWNSLRVSRQRGRAVQGGAVFTACRGSSAPPVAAPLQDRGGARAAVATLASSASKRLHTVEERSDRAPRRVRSKASILDTSILSRA